MGVLASFVSARLTWFLGKKRKTLIVAITFCSNAQGQRTHSARTRSRVYSIIVKVRCSLVYETKIFFIEVPNIEGKVESFIPYLVKICQS